MVVKRTTSWFRQNFSVAHELGHLAHGSLCDRSLTSEEAVEAAANVFAAELLMPEAQLRSLDWTRIELPFLADRVWNWGVSTQAVDVRLRALHITPHEGASVALGLTTQGLLRRHWTIPAGPDPITRRMELSAERRFPTELITMLEAAVTAGRAPAGSLAFALGVDVEDLDLEQPSLADPVVDRHLLEGLI